MKNLIKLVIKHKLRSSAAASIVVTWLQTQGWVNDATAIALATVISIMIGGSLGHIIKKEKDAVPRLDRDG